MVILIFVLDGIEDFDESLGVSLGVFVMSEIGKGVFVSVMDGL